MRPTTQYIELGSEGTTPNIIHRVGVEVDGTQFIGEGRSKKLARKAASTQACNTLFDCDYELELPLAAENCAWKKIKLLTIHQIYKQ